MLKHRFLVSWWIGIRFSQKKVTETVQCSRLPIFGVRMSHPTGKCNDWFV